MESDPDNFSKALDKIQQLERRQEQMSKEIAALKQKLGVFTKKESSLRSEKEEIALSPSKPIDTQKPEKEHSKLLKGIFPTKSNIVLSFWIITYCFVIIIEP